MSAGNVPVVQIPKTEADVTPEWIETVVGLAPDPGSLKITANVQHGVGFLSNLCRVNFLTNNGKKEHNVLVKMLPNDPMFRMLTISQSFDQREVQFYNQALPKILEVSPEIAENFCKIFCAKSGDPANEEDYSSMIVMEDLKPEGYQMLNSDSENWHQNFTEITKFLARFQASGRRLEKNDGRGMEEIFPFCMGTGNWQPTTLITLGYENLPRLDAILEEHGVDEKIRDAYKKIGKNMEQVFSRCFAETSKYCSLIHGDLWPPNVMIVEGQGKEEAPKIKIIDWQLLGYRDPVVELTVTMLTCLPIGEFKRERLEEFCGVYLEAWKAALGDGEEDRGREQFQREFSTWGMVYAYIWFMLGVDSFQSAEGQRRFVAVLKFLEEEYKITEFLFET